jgi:murein DD-endopeptidase MepM/ murein hydrolase activator NlpD
VDQNNELQSDTEHEAHLNNSLVRQGSTVKRGTPIAIVGKSGRSTGPSLHYEIRLQGQPINPEPLLIMM